jgi:hypothetical protein
VAGRFAVIDEGQTHEETRTLWRVALGADGSTGFLHDFSGYGEAEAGAAVFGRVERQEEALADFSGESVTCVGNFDFDSGPVFCERGLNAEYTKETALHGLGGRPGSRLRLTVIPSRRPAKRARASSAI